MFESLEDRTERTDGQYYGESEIVLRWIAITMASVALFGALVLAIWFLS